MTESKRLSFEDYRKGWSQSVASVFNRRIGIPLDVRPVERQARREPAGACALFQMGAPLSGEQALSLSTAASGRFKQLLQSQLDPGAAADAAAGALSDSFREIAEAASAALTACLGRSVDVALAGTNPPSWQPAPEGSFDLELSGTDTNGSPTSLALLHFDLSPGLYAALAAPAGNESHLFDTVSPGAEQNLAFLQDVELGVTLRFGKQQVLIRDIIEMEAGSIVALEQLVDDPVELLIGSKVIARGEAVVVDGNYGFRVTEVLKSAGAPEAD
jgi:flagellar motor switch protein FliN